MKTIITLIVLVGIVLWFITCTSQNGSENDVRGPAYAGSAACIKCHKDITDDYAHNGHFKTSSKTDFEAIKKIITASNDTVHFPGNQFVLLQAADDKVSQCYFLNGNLYEKQNMDITFGSGEKAMTFGYWKDDKLFQLPLTYLSELKRWTNSPGFTENYPSFSRLIVGRCMECHSSYASVQTQVVQRVGQQSEEKIYAQTIVYGIDCERCHGPAAQHVAFQTASRSENGEIYYPHRIAQQAAPDGSLRHLPFGRPGKAEIYFCFSARRYAFKLLFVLPGRSHKPGCTWYASAIAYAKPMLYTKR